MFSFQHNVLHRHGHQRHQEQFLDSKLNSNNTFFLPVHEQSIVCKEAENSVEPNPEPYWLGYEELARKLGDINKKHLIYLGEIDSKHYLTYRLKSHALNDLTSEANNGVHYNLYGLRELFKRLSPAQSELCNIAIAIEHWHNTHQYCGYCGHQTYSNKGGYVRTCSNPDCATEHFPRTDSAVICAITFEDKILLGRQQSWPNNLYSVIAGFVEPGETLEQAVAREAYEETGLSLQNIRYYKSQPWPFPQSLMVGFTAEAESPNILLHDKELETAGWYNRGDIERGIREKTLILPFEYSISRTLIDQWLTKR